MKQTVMRLVEESQVPMEKKKMAAAALALHAEAINSIPVRDFKSDKYLFPILFELNREKFFSAHGYSCQPSLLSVNDSKFIQYPGVAEKRYMISTNGKIFDVLKNMSKESTVGSDGYVYIYLQNIFGKSIRLGIHRLVAYAFCNPPANFDSLIVNHIDGNVANNDATNLEWVTTQANNQHSQRVLHKTERMGTKCGGRPPVTPLLVSKLCSLMQQGKSDTEILLALGIERNESNYGILRDIRTGRTWVEVSKDYIFPKFSKEHNLTVKEIAMIEDMVRNGATDKDIFESMTGKTYSYSEHSKDSFYRSIHTVRLRLERNGIVKSNSGRLTAEVADRIAQMLESGMTSTDIISKLGWENNNASRKKISRVRKGQVFPEIVNKYNIPQVLTQTEFTEPQKQRIIQLINQGKLVSEIFGIVMGRPYVNATDHNGKEYEYIRHLATRIRHNG